MAKPKELYVGINKLTFCLYDEELRANRFRGD